MKCTTLSNISYTECILLQQYLCLPAITCRKGGDIYEVIVYNTSKQNTQLYNENAITVI